MYMTVNSHAVFVIESRKSFTEALSMMERRGIIIVKSEVPITSSEEDYIEDKEITLIKIDGEKKVHLG